MTDESYTDTEEVDESATRTDGVDPNAPRGYGDASTPAAPEEGYVCSDCGERWFYARARCRDCGGTDHATYELGVGTLLAVTTARVTPADVRDDNPLGLAEFDDDVTVLAQLSTGDRRPAVGKAVTLTGTTRLRDGVRGARLYGAEDNPPVGHRDERARRQEGHES